MKFETVYLLCTLVSCIIEIVFSINFYKAFHSPRRLFSQKRIRVLAGIGLVLVNFAINLANNTMLNVLSVTVIHLLIVLVMFEGTVSSRLIHWLMFIVMGLGAELVFSLFLSLPYNVNTNEVYHSEFFMISVIFAVKMTMFILLSLVKQMSKYTVEKLSKQMFFNYILVPFATLGIMFAIPYTRVGGKALTGMDIVLIVFYILLLCANMRLFYIFSHYSFMKEQQWENEVLRTKYESKLEHYREMEESERTHRELFHNIKYYLRQIGDFSRVNNMEKIKDILAELQVQIEADKQLRICQDFILNAILLDFRGAAVKENIDVDIMVEKGFSSEFIKPIDVAVFLGNLLDNAVEAAVKSGKKKISVKFFIQNHGSLAVFCIKNTYQGVIKKRGEQLLTSKEDTRFHGIGLQSVNRIVTSYGGYVHSEYENGIYVSTVVIPVKHEKA